MEMRYQDGIIIGPDCDEARALYNQARYGAFNRKQYQLNMLEALYLVEKKKIKIISRGELSIEALQKKAKKEPNFLIRYAVYRDLRERGYIVKTAFKFGADFRVYDRGIKPGEDHAKWIVYPCSENSKHTWHEFSAKNRVAHSTKKRLLLGIVDDEGDVTYYEVKWVRP